MLIPNCFQPNFGRLKELSFSVVAKFRKNATTQPKTTTPLDDQSMVDLLA